MLQDLKLALRTFRTKPIFAFAVIAVMAISIGACTAIFSIVNSVLLFHLPYAASERLVIIWHTLAQSGAGVGGMSARDYRFYRDNARSFESLAAVSTQGFNVSTASNPMRITCARVTSDLFPMLGIAPAQGRRFTPSDDRPEAEKVVILSRDFLRGYYGDDLHLVGRTINLDMNPHVVVGVMPEGVQFPPEGIPGLEHADCYVPAAFSQTELNMPGFNVVVFGKLKPGITLTQANIDANLVAKLVLDSYPPEVQKEIALRARVVELGKQVTSSSRTALLIFSVAVGFLLLVGCANITNLALVRLQDRQRGIAVRIALGASRASLARQTVTECIVLALIGGTIGIFLAGVILRTIVALNPGGIPRLNQAHVDLATLVFTTLCSILAGIICGLLPAMRTNLQSPREILVENSRGSSGGVSSGRIRAALVVLETAITLVLLVGAGLLLRSYTRLMQVFPGFEPDQVLTFAIALPMDQYRHPVEFNRFLARVMDRIQYLPSVEVAAAGSSLPIGKTDYTVMSRIDAPVSAAGFKLAAIQTVTPSYHKALGITLKQGRLLQENDAADTLPVAVVNETMAKRYWPDTSILGQRFFWVSGQRVLTVVGEAADVHQGGLENSPVPLFYIPTAQSQEPMHNLFFAIKTGVTPQSIEPAIRRTLREIEPLLPVYAMQPATDILYQSVAPQRFSAFLIALFAGSALILAILGIYAVIAYVVSNSAKEIGIRIALGADPIHIIHMVMKKGMAWVAIGLCSGAAVALGLTRFMSTLLFEIKPYDFWTFLSVAAILLLVSIAAVAIPAARAARVDPMISLRNE